MGALWERGTIFWGTWKSHWLSTEPQLTIEIYISSFSRRCKTLMSLTFWLSDTLPMTPWNCLNLCRMFQLNLRRVFSGSTTTSNYLRGWRHLSRNAQPWGNFGNIDSLYRNFQDGFGLYMLDNITQIQLNKSWSFICLLNLDYSTEGFLSLQH